MKHRKASFIGGFLAIVLAALACTCGQTGQIGQLLNTASTAQAVATQVDESLPTLVIEATNIAAQVTANAPTYAAEQTAIVQTADALANPGGTSGGQSGTRVNQWAAAASGTSQYGSDSWSASQAAGAADTTECGDITTAWATAQSNGVDALTLDYVQAVIPTSINVYQTYNPGAINQVEVVDAGGTHYTVYSGAPSPIQDCPFVQTFPVTGVNAPVAQVIIHLDQSNHTSWNEIDAVELVGTP